MSGSSPKLSEGSTSNTNPTSLQAARAWVVTEVLSV